MASKRASTQSRPMHRDLWIDDVEITDRVLGKGAYGEVVEVIWNGTSCAGKRVHQLLIGEGSHVVQSFKRECETWSMLRHPNVAQFLGLFYETRASHSERNIGDTLPMIVVEKMDTTLRRLMEDTMREKLPTSVRVDILCQVARGMVYLHNQSPSVVHRDLTPNNILVNTDSLAVKLSDFGVAKVIQPHNNSMTSVPGTPHFMPPEVFAKGNTIGSDLRSRIDVFSFGVLIVFVIVHKWPEPAPNVIQEKGKLIALNEVERREAYINQFTTEEKKHFLGTVHRCLSYDPNHRPSSSDLLKAMESLAQLDEYRLRKVPVVQQSVLVNEKEVTLEMIARLGKELETRAAQMEEMKKQLLQETKANTSLKKEITMLEKEKQELAITKGAKVFQLQCLQQKHSELEGELKSLQKKLRKAEEDVSTVRLSNDFLKQQLATKKRETEKCQEELSVSKTRLEDMKEQISVLRCDVDVATAEKISLQELHHTELQKWKETASENKRECTLLSERVAQREMEIADLNNELLSYEDLMNRFQSVKMQKKRSSTEEPLMITRQVSSGSGGKDTSENIPKGTTVAVPAQKEGLGLGLGSKTTAPDGATNSVVASQGAVWVRGEAYFNMPPLVEEVIPDRKSYSRDFLLKTKNAMYCMDPHNCGPLLHSPDYFVALAVDKEKAVEIVHEAGLPLLQPSGVWHKGMAYFDPTPVGMLRVEDLSEEQMEVFDLLLNLNYPQDAILSGLAHCGPDFDAVVDFCMNQFAKDLETPPPVEAQKFLAIDNDSVLKSFSPDKPVAQPIQLNRCTAGIDKKQQPSPSAEHIRKEFNKRVKGSTFSSSSKPMYLQQSSSPGNLQTREELVDVPSASDIKEQFRRLVQTRVTSPPEHAVYQQSTDSVLQSGLTHPPDTPPPSGENIKRQFSQLVKDRAVLS